MCRALPYPILTRQAPVCSKWGSLSGERWGQPSPGPQMEARTAALTRSPGPLQPRAQAVRGAVGAGSSQGASGACGQGAHGPPWAEGLTLRSRATISLDQVGTYCTLAVLNSCTRDSTALLEWMS